MEINKLDYHFKVKDMKCKVCNTNEASKHKSMCNPCRYKHDKQRDSIGVSYRRLKSHAKARGKEFTLTKKEFAEFCVKSEYAVGSGIYKNCLHVDRIDENKGYHIDNIQALTNSENVKKYCKWVNRDQYGVNQFTTQTQVRLSQINISNCPF